MNHYNIAAVRGEQFQSGKYVLITASNGEMMAAVIVISSREVVGAWGILQIVSKNLGGGIVLAWRPALAAKENFTRLWHVHVGWHCWRH